MKKAVTIKSIAEQLGLSRNTVAKALNGQYVPEATRERVLNKAKELNYKSFSSSPVTIGAKRYKILLVSGKPLRNISFFLPLVKGIENSCYENNFELFQYTYNVDEMSFSQLVTHMKDLQADGIVAIECFDKSLIEKLINFGKPICFYDFSTGSVKTDKPFDIVNTTDQKSISEIVQSIHNKYKVNSFTFVGDRRHCKSFYDRYLGMRMGILSFAGSHSIEHDILCNDRSFPYGNPDAIKTEILKLRQIPECFICCNDFVARNVVTALKKMQLKVPENALIVGYDNAPDATATKPTITTFSIDKDFLGIEMIRTLVHRMENTKAPSRIITVRTNTIFRKSTDRLPT